MCLPCYCIPLTLYVYSKNTTKVQHLNLHSQANISAPLKVSGEGGRRIPGAHCSSGRDNRPSSSLFARRNAAPMLHLAVTAADLDHGRGWLLEGASHFSSCGALSFVLLLSLPHAAMLDKSAEKKAPPDLAGGQGRYEPNWGGRSARRGGVQVRGPQRDSLREHCSPLLR